ncbi:MAG: HAMP domain-containing histidine kinase [Actinomycetota bacterium]|nr:HAMP domain-containing histidine kinase [Actinomycetota bacterium]
MFRSLRFRLPAFFLAGVVVAGLVSTAIAVKLFQDYTRDRVYSELRREARGLTGLYGLRAGGEAFSSRHLEDATGDLLFYVPVARGIRPFPDRPSALRELSTNAVDWQKLRRGSVEFEFTPPGREKTYLAVARTVKVGDRTWGALVVASPESQLQGRWVTLIQRLALAFAAGIAVAAALGWYLSRRITKPVLALAEAADEVAEGRYGVEVPAVPGGGEIGDLAERFRQMAARLQEADERERTFLMSVSHELRTPLTAIRGHIEALREGVAADEEAREESLNVVLGETGRLERLVGDVLDLAKLNARRFQLRHEEVDMGRLLDGAFAAYAEEARRRRIDYRQDLDGRPVIVSDGDRVLQIISNLLANAFRWTPDGGSIELAMEARNGEVAVSVTDSGPGVAPEERERIFRPFWTRDGRGTGLGLAIARELAVALGGMVDLQTELGRGSRFRLLLPRP